MPLDPGAHLRMATLRQAGNGAISRIEQRLDNGDTNLEPIYEALRVLYDVLREMNNTVDPVVNAAERMAEEYHQLKEELEDQN